MAGIADKYRETCIVCMGPTDSGFAFQGPVEGAIAVLQVMGVPRDQAVATIGLPTTGDPGMLPEGDGPWALRVCEMCAAPTGLKVGVIALGIPVYLVPDVA